MRTIFWVRKGEGEIDTFLKKWETIEAIINRRPI
jgi:hypothetical protein